MLPLEIIAYIFSFASDGSLKACSLVHSSWLHVAQSQLFRHVAVSSSKPAQCIAFFDSAPHLAVYARRLSLEVDKPDLSTMFPCQPLLQLLPHITTLELRTRHQEDWGTLSRGTPVARGPASDPDGSHTLPSMTAQVTALCDCSTQGYRRVKPCKLASLSWKSPLATLSRLRVIICPLTLSRLTTLVLDLEFDLFTPRATACSLGEDLRLPNLISLTLNVTYRNPKFINFHLVLEWVLKFIRQMPSPDTLKSLTISYPTSTLRTSSVWAPIEATLEKMHIEGALRNVIICPTIPALQPKSPGTLGLFRRNFVKNSALVVK